MDHPGMIHLGADTPFPDPEAWIAIGFLAMAIGFSLLLWLFHDYESRIRRALVIGEVVIGLGFVVGLFVIDTDWDADSKPNYDYPVLVIDAGQLAHTIVTPYLEQTIDGRNNVLWCATLPLAWNELVKLNQGAIRFQDQPAAVEILNHQEITRTVIDEGAAIALAGSNSPELRNQIAAELDRKFGSRADPVLFNQLKDLDLLMYAYLLKDLPFRWAFERFPGTFNGKRVASFGIHQYFQAEKNEALAASQVKVYDYRGSDDFILELETASVNDRMVIAKIPPEPTLQNTIETVSRRLGDTQPDTIPELATLRIPILDFDLTKRFSELQGIMISDNPQLDGVLLAIVMQRIRFTLNERGARIESEALGAIGIGDSLLIDKPFLLVLQKKDQRLPYFAAWIANEELLIPVQTDGR